MCAEEEESRTRQKIKQKQGGQEMKPSNGYNSHKSERLRIMNDLAEHVANGTTADAGGIMRAPVSDFTCPQLLAQEQNVFFRNTPLCMGLSSELPEPNTYWSDSATGIPILMVRDGEGQFRAYANVCRHRGSPVVSEGRGSKDRFICPFHAWTYGIDGSLLAVYKNRHFGNVSSMDLPLVALPSAEMYGTLWVRPTEGDPIDVDECLAGLQDDLIHWKLSDHPHAGMQVIDARINWKLGLDSYGEIYHLNILHAKTVAKEILGNLQTFESFNKNLRMVFANRKFNLIRMLIPDPGRWPYKQLTSTVYFLYPNVIVLVDAFGIDFLRLFPLEDSPSKSRTIHTWYIDPMVQQHLTDNEISYEHRLRTFRDVVEKEDYAMLEDVQINAERRVPSEIVLGRNEAALQHFRNAHRSGLGRELLSVEEI